MDVQLRVLPDVQQLVDAVAAGVVSSIVAELESYGRADVVLTGGGVGTAVALHLVDLIPQTLVDWTNVHLWWGDERFVPYASADRNDLPVVSALRDIPPPRPTLHRVGESSIDFPLADASSAYQTDIEDMFALKPDRPPFVVVLLGLGPDGHVASIFPGRPSIESSMTCQPVSDSPKPPANRVSMSLATLRKACQVWILASGTEKHQALERLMSDETHPTDIPARGVQGIDSTIVWADTQAAYGATQ